MTILGKGRVKPYVQQPITEKYQENIMKRFAFAVCTTLIMLMSLSSLASAEEKPWRIRFLEAVIVEGENVRLGEVAVPVGEMPPAEWERMSLRELWPAPREGGKAMNMTRPKLQEAVARYMNDLAPYCLFPGSMAVQRGGVVLNRVEVHDMVVKSLTPLLGGLPGESGLSDIRTPQYVFMAHKGQTLSVEPPKRIQPGRLSIRLLVREMDGKITQRLTGSVFIDCWVEAPSATSPLNRGDLLEPSKVAFVRTNMASLRSDMWDGRGGPWRILRPIGAGEVIYQADLGSIPTVSKGNTVTLIYEGGDIFLSVPAQALEDGVVGQSIPVRNLQSKKQVFAIVRDAGTVVIRGRNNNEGF